MRRLIVLFVMLLASSVCWGQTQNQGAIIGTVTDPTGAVIPGVRVTLRNVDTGVTRSVASTAAGDYRAEFLSPGKYEVTAELQGFKRAAVTGITLNVGQLMRVDLKLELGAVAQEVTVSSTAAAINTETATLGNVITEQAIQNLPLNGREYLQLASLVPGAESGSPKRGTPYSKGYAVGFNGARASYNLYYIDGADSTDPLYNTLASSPALDAIKEFRVETNMYSAQYGRWGGAIISVVTNSGTNAFHGTLYEFHRNKALDARPAFSTQDKVNMPMYLFNQYGGTVGGPIKKNKTFFFFSLERFRQKKQGGLIVTFVPTDRERAGDVSQTYNPFSYKPVVLINPYTQQPIPGNKLPANLMTPVGQKLLSTELWPKPNYAAVDLRTDFLNYRFFRGGANKTKKYLVRADHNFNERNVLFGTFDMNDYNNDSVWHNIYADKLSGEHNRTMSMTFTHTFTPTLVNDVKVNHTWYYSGSAFKLADKNYGASWGFYSGSNPSINQDPGTPRILMYTQNYNRYDIGQDGDYKHTNRTLFIKDNLAWVKKNHTILVGGDMRREDFGWVYGAAHSAYYFGVYEGVAGQDQNYLVTGSTFTTALMGLSQLEYYNPGKGYMPLFRNAFSFYVQDDWKVTRRLTLNLGLRYDYEAPFTSKNHQFMTVDWTTGLPRYAKGAPADVLATLRFPFLTDGPSRPYEPSYKNFAPRVGFALRPFADNRTVIRGGFGMFYTSENAFTTVYGSWVSPFGGQFGWWPRGIQWPDKLDHWTTVDQKPYGYEYRRGAGPGYYAPNNLYYPTGYLEQWNLTFARDMGGKVALELGYIGSAGHQLTGVGMFPTSVSSKTAAAQTGVSIGVYRDKGFNSKYNSLQASVRKDFSHGLYFLSAYTWSHALAEASNDDANEQWYSDTDAVGSVIKRRWANADFDVRHRFSVSGGYELPFGRGKRYGSTWHPVVDGILGGWALQYITTFQGGYPHTVYDPALCFPDRVCDGNLPASERKQYRWFDFSCFKTHVGTTGPQLDASGNPVINPATGQPFTRTYNRNGNAGSNILTGPGTNNWDLGIQKNFRITESKKLQFRAEMFNAFNHPQLVAPQYFFNTVPGAQITNSRAQRDIQLALKFIF